MTETIKFKESFIIHHDTASIFQKLTNEQAGELIKYIISYSNALNENPKEPKKPSGFSSVISLIAHSFEMQLERDFWKYQEVVKKNAKNGKKGGRPIKESKNKNPKKPKKADSDNDSDNEKDCIAMQCTSFKNEKWFSKILKPKDEGLTLEAFMDICNKNKKYIDGEHKLEKWEEKYNIFKTNRNNDKSETASLTWQDYLTEHWLTHEWEMKTLKQGQEPVKVKTQKEKEEELKKIELNEKITAENLSTLNDYCKNFLSYREKAEDSIRRQFGDAVFDSWFSTFKIAVENLTLCFFVEKEKYKNAILIHYSTKLERVLGRVIKEEIGYKNLKVMSYGEFR